MVRACDKNGRRTITAKSVTLSSRRRTKSWSTTKTRMSCIKEDVAEQDKSIQQQAVNLPETEQRGVDSCLHHHHRKMMEDKEEEEE